MPKHDKPEPPRVDSLGDIVLLSQMRPGPLFTNLIGQPMLIKVKTNAKPR